MLLSGFEVGYLVFDSWLMVVAGVVIGAGGECGYSSEQGKSFHEINISKMLSNRK